MTTTTTLLVLALAAAGDAAPWAGGGTPLCSTECSIAASKLSYIPGKTYSYSYTGKSMVELKGMEGGVSEMEWQKQVEVTWLTPCDMAITVKVSGGQGGPDDRFLQKYPMVAAVSDGRVHHVCSHPNDEAWAINIKKGIASAFQNSLPSFSTIRTPQNLTEIDVLGNCSTSYQVEGEGNRVVVTKEKNHRTCPQRYNTPSETHLPWLKAPLPIQESWCKCTQEINSGIYSSIRCEDHKVIKPMYGSYKFVHAKQESTLRYQSMTDTQPDAISTLSQSHLVQKTLNFDYQAPQKEESLVPQLEQILSNICHNTKDALEHNTAGLMAQALHIMRRVPHQTLPQILQKIRSKQICPDNPKLESLFLDAIAFAQEAGSVKIMVDEIVSGRVTGGRTALYTAAFYLLPRPCIHIVSALQPLFESERPPTSTKLAAASMVNRYCRQNRHCYDEAPVKSVAQALSNKLQRQCSSSSTPKPALTTLKALANMGVITPEVASSVLTCMETETPNINVRVAAAQAFRLANCHHQSTRRLINYAVDGEKNTEVRIAAYLAAVRCIRQEDIARIVERISIQPNTQVRGFILSHLINLQQSDALEKQHLRYMLTNYTLPRNFEVDIRKYSRNIDLSYWAPSLGLGAGLESNIIYSPGSFIPRSLDFNLTAALDGIALHIGELGARIQGLEPVIEQIFGPDGYIQKSTYEKMFQDAIQFIQKNWNKIQQEWENLRHRRSVDLSFVSNFFNSLYGDRPTIAHADAFARIMGLEIDFVSLSGDLKHFDTVRFIEEIMEKLQQMLPDLRNINLDSARTARINVEYYFPTVQGTPIKLQHNTTLVTALKMKGNLPSIFSGWPRGQNMLDITPSFSLEQNGFIGFDAHIMKTGLMVNTTVSSANGLIMKVSATSDSELQMELDIPRRMEIINMEMDTYLMKRKSGEPETRVNPPSMRDIRIPLKSCITRFESILGLKMCYDIDVSDVFRSNSLPLMSHPAIAKIHLEKVEAGLKGYLMALSLKEEGSKNILRAKIATKGSSPPREAEVQTEYKKEHDLHTAILKVDSPTIKGKLEGHIKNQENYKFIETYVELSTGDKNFATGIKIDLKKTITSGGNGMEYDMNVYNSESQHFSPESVIFETKYKQENKEPKMDIEFMTSTKNAFREYIPIDFHIGGEVEYITRYRLPVPTKLDKLEFEGDLMDWKLVSFLRGSGGSGARAQYLSGFKLSRGGQDLVSVEANMDIQGAAGVDMVFTTSVKGKVGAMEYKTDSSIEYSQSKQAMKVQIIRQSDNVKILDLDTSLQRGQSFATHLLVESQLFTEGIKFEAKVAGQGEAQYMVKMGLTRGGRSLLLIQGPVTANISPRTTKLQADITINNDKRLATTFIFQDSKQVVSVRFEKQQQPIFVVEWNMKSGSSQGTKTSGRIMVPKIIDSNVDIVITESVLHASINTILMPNTDIARRVKAFTDLNLDSKQLQAVLSWDADKDPSKKASMHVQVVRYSSNPQQVLIQSEVVVESQNYHIKMDLEPGTLLTQYQGQGSFMIELTTPARQTHAMNTQVNIQHRSNYIMIDSRINYKTPENRQYKLISKMKWEKATGPYGFKVDSHLGYTSPEGRQNSFTFLASHHNSPQERKIEVKATAKTPSLSRPLVIHLQVINQENSYKVKVETEVSQAATMFNWHMETFPQGGIKTFDTAIDMKAIRDLMQEVMRMIGARNPVSMYYSNQRYMFRSRYHSPDPSTHSVLIQSPSRTMEGQVKYSLSELVLHFYPNRDKSDTKYELAAKSSHGFYETKYEGRVSHPILSRDVAGHMEYSTSGSGVQGSFELDIFPDTADKVTGTLRSTLIANNTVRVEFDLQSRMLQMRPRVSLEYGWAPHTKANEFMFHKTPTSPSSLTMAAKYDQIMPRESVVAIRVVTEDGPVMDLTGVIKAEMVPHCNGFQIDAKVRTSIIGDFDIQSEVCKPVYIKMITKRPQANKIYITKFGIQLPHIAEVSIIEADSFNFNKRPVFITGIDLVSPLRMKIKFGFDIEEIWMIKDFVMEETMRMVRASSSWAAAVYENLEQQARQKRIPFPNPDILKILLQITEDSSQIYQEVMSEVVNPVWEIINNFLEGPTASYISQMFSWVRSGFVNYMDGFKIMVKESIQAWIREFKGITDTIIQAVTQMGQWVQTGQEPELLRRLIQNLQESSMMEIMKREVLEVIRSMYPDQYSSVQEMIEKVMIELIRDIEKGRQYLINIPVTNTIITAITNTFNNEERLTEVMSRYISSQLLRMGAGVEVYDGVAMVTIPLYRPMYSVSQAMLAVVKEPHMVVVAATPLNSVLDTYNTWLPPHHPLPPFNATAMVVDDIGIITFDGEFLHVPRSNCKVLLASIPGVARITKFHPQPTSRPEITFQAGQVHAIINPDLTVKLNGQQVTSEKTVSPLTVKVTPHDVKVESPLMGLHLLKEERVMMVNVSGWVFNHTQGMLGSYDGEVANDWHMRSGRNATNLQELIKSWQENPSCPVPSIIIPNVPTKRYIQCQLLFFMMKAGQPVVDPRPFLEQCYTGPTACRGAKAYHEACTALHVVFPISIPC